MFGSRASQRGQVAVYAILLFPLLMLVLTLVLAVGTLESLRSRTRAQLDMAALTATQALDFDALAHGAAPQLNEATADALAREYLARNLAVLGDQLQASPADIAQSAEIVVSNTPGIDPITGASDSAPTVCMRFRVRARIPLLGLLGVSSIVVLTLTGFSV
jgi:hypothetical protein